MDFKSSIFVFGSNEGGLHGAGAARFALEYKGAILRNPVGLQGQSYAIPTKDASIRNTLPLEKIKGYVNEFIEFTHDNPTMTFQVTRIGCGLAGLTDEEVAPLFEKAVSNCWFDYKWGKYLTGGRNYWGSK